MAAAEDKRLRRRRCEEVGTLVDRLCCKNSILLAKGSSSKSSKARCTGFTERNALEPCEQTGHIDSGSRRDMLHMGFCQAKIASLP